jgi:O-antigen/teichoic acid export membrane protein
LESKTPKWEQLKNIWINSRTARDILKVSIGDIASKVFSFATVFLLIRGLSIADYAAFMTFSGISVLFSGVIGAGINMAVVRFSSDQLSKKKKPFVLYLFAIFLQLTLYLSLAGICLLFPTQSTRILFGQPTVALPLQLGLLAGLGLLILQYARTLYQAEEKFNSYIGTIWLVQIIIFLCLFVIWWSGSLSFLSVAITFTVVQLGAGLWILTSYLRKDDLFSPQKLIRSQDQELKNFFVSSAWLIGYFIVLNLFSRMDVFMLLRFRGPEELAIYGVAFQYYSLALLFLGSIHAVLLPKFSKAEMEDIEKQKAFLKHWFQWSIWLAIPILLFDVFGKPIFIGLNGSMYENSFPIFIIFSTGIWLSMIFSPLVNILISKGNFRFLFFLSIVGLCVNILLNLWLVPSFGGMGAALAAVTSVSVINIFSFIKLQVAIS